MATSKTSSLLGIQFDPTRVLSTALVAMLNQHRDRAFPDYDFLMGAVRAQNWKALLDWSKHHSSPLPSSYAEQGLDQFDVYLIRREFVALFRKFQFLPDESGQDPEAAALKGFWANERRCARYNRKLRLLLRNPSYLTRKGGGMPDRVDKSRLHLYQFLDGCRKWIKLVLGSRPDMASIYSKCDFGGGSSIGVTGNATNVGRKILADEFSVTPDCAPLAFAAWMANPHLRGLLCPAGADQALVSNETYYWTFRQRLRLVSYNKLEFVPKTAMVHRAIATEPLLNGFVQKGIDLEMRQKMLRFGIDLKYGWKFNQIWARAGSHERDDGFATLDLSSASDTICRELVRFLLPSEWWSLLNMVRSPAVRINDTEYRVEKFCSMGNGFCFPLETLIFASFSRQAAIECGQSPRFLTFGDDIIVKQSVVPLLIKRLVEVGFIINQDKSFWSGEFRESCGADWVRGREVTPVYMRKRIDNVSKLIAFHNSLSTKCFGENEKFPYLTKALRNLVPEHLRPVELYRPGAKPFNTGFVVPQDEFLASPLTRWDAETMSWQSLELTSSPKPDKLEHPLRNAVEYFAVLRGSTSAQPLSLRRETKTRVQRFSARGRDQDLMIASGRYLPLNS